MAGEVDLAFQGLHPCLVHHWAAVFLPHQFMVGAGENWRDGVILEGWIGSECHGRGSQYQAAEKNRKSFHAVAPST